MEVGRIGIDWPLIGWRRSVSFRSVSSNQSSTIRGESITESVVLELQGSWVMELCSLDSKLEALDSDRSSIPFMVLLRSILYSISKFMTELLRLSLTTDGAVLTSLCADVIHF